MAIIIEDTPEVRAYLNGKAWALDSLSLCDDPTHAPDVVFFAAKASEEATALYGPNNERNCQFVSGAVDVAEARHFEQIFRFTGGN